MTNKKAIISKGVLVFLYIRLFAGLIMMFYPFPLGEWAKNIVIVVGGLVVLTSGIEVKFNHLFKSIKKPS
jgi:hypothetical protein